MECPECEREYERLGQHFAYAESHRPSLSDYQQDVLSFLSLIGGYVRNDSENPRLEIYSTNLEYIEAVDEALGWLSNGPRVYQDAEQAVERYQERFNCETEPTNWNRIWALSTISHPEISEYVLPTDMASLSPRVLRWLLLAKGEWVGTVLGTLHIDVRSAAVDGDRLKEFLREIGVQEFCEDTKTWQGDLMHRGHWDPDIVTVPHGWAMSLLDHAGLGVDDVPWTHDLFVTEDRMELTLA